MRFYDFEVSQPLYFLALEADSKTRRLIERMDFSNPSEFSVAERMDEFILVYSTAVRTVRKVLWAAEDGRRFSSHMSKREIVVLLEEHITNIQKIKENSGLYEREAA
ncbi:hypothetical protein [Oceaniglobus indicus]|uniref:hypothetical protein n=1 Tax=Oceaniglobus indicus TaxID=2047749 RepID=UPI000C19FB63|nr:hypothetical protein [Oceaniglobus indicus]